MGNAEHSILHTQHKAAQNKRKQNKTKYSKVKQRIAEECNIPVDESPEGGGEEEHIGVYLQLWYLSRHTHLRSRSEWEA